MVTKKQKQILDFITKYIKRYGFSPSLEETAKHFKLKAVSTVHQHIKALEDKGYLQKQKNQRRGIEVARSEKMVSIPLLGTIAAGQPIETFAETKETIAVPQNRIPKTGEIYALKVAGESMIDEGVHDGDIILVEHRGVAENGQKVVALLDNYNTTLKTYYKEKNHIRLQPANKNFEPIIVKKDRDFAIQGVVLDVIKNDNRGLIDLEYREENLSHKKKLDNRNIQKHLNKVFLGDVMDLLKDLPDNSVDMLFGDPDYNVGVKYGDKNYTKNFNEYIEWYIGLAKESLRVLKPDGNLFMLNYPKQNAYLRVKYLDNFYPLIHEYAWVYNTNVGHTPKRFTTAHRTILHVRKSENSKFYKDAVALPYKNPGDKRILKNLKGGSKGRMPYSWFYFDLVKNVSKEKTYHACQIPQKLTEMLIKATTRPNDVVLILFGGSGSELEVCKKLDRNYISAEIDKKYYDLIMDRLKNGYIKDEYRLKFVRKITNNRREPLPLNFPRKGELSFLPDQNRNNF